MLFLSSCMPLNVADCLCTRITCIMWIFCPALNETIIPVCLLKPQLKSLFEIPSIPLFASPSCQRFVQFICRSPRSESTLKPLATSFVFQREFSLCAARVLMPLLWSQNCLKDPLFLPLSYYLFDPSHGCSLHVRLKICSCGETWVSLNGCLAHTFFFSFFLFILTRSYSVQFWT